MSKDPLKTPRIIFLRSILVFLAISFLGLWVSYVDIQQHREEMKFTALQVATAEVATLSQRLNASISLVYTKTWTGPFTATVTETIPLSTTYVGSGWTAAGTARTRQRALPGFRP